MNQIDGANTSATTKSGFRLMTEEEIRAEQKELLGFLREAAIRALREEAIRKGLRDPFEEGRVRGKRELLRHMLASRFGPITADVDVRLVDASATDLDAWSMRLLTAVDLAHVFSGD